MIILIAGQCWGHEAQGTLRLGGRDMGDVIVVVVSLWWGWGTWGTSLLSSHCSGAGGCIISLWWGWGTWGMMTLSSSRCGEAGGRGG